MVQYIKQGSTAGRFGTGLGKGLGEQIPKEVERNRLSSGLKALSEKKDLNPIEFMSEFYGIPGVAQNPQIVQSGTQLYNQMRKGQALTEQKSQTNPFETDRRQTDGAGISNIPSVTKSGHLEEAQQGYIPPTQEEIFADAGRRYQANPALFNHDPQKAIEAAETSAERNRLINEAHVKQHERLQNIQDNVASRLNKQFEFLTSKSGKVPADVYSKIEDKAINSVRPKKDGGKGLTEQQAIKDYGKELQEVDRKYNDLSSVGNWSIPFKPAEKTLSNIRELQKDFKKRDDLRNFAESLVANSGLSNMFANSLADPIGENKDLNGVFKTVPSIPKIQPQPMLGGILNSQITPTEIRDRTLRIMPDIVENLGSTSPLSVLYELEKKNYDVDVARKYMQEHDEKMNKIQSEQLGKTETPFGRLNDWWLKTWTGIK